MKNKIDLDRKIDKVVSWLREQTDQAGAQGLLVGVSGGVDSALAAFLIKRACPDNSLAVILPCHSLDQDKEDALKVITACGIAHLEADLSATFDCLTAQLTASVDRGRRDGPSAAGRRMFADKDLSDSNFAGLAQPFNEKSALANLKARLRMSSLYFIANGLNYLVIGTDNAAETYTGYFTKYGDGGADLLPIANLKKREVYQWAGHLGVPESVLTKEPSAGLWEGQTDQKEMGTSYEMIDNYLDGQAIPDRDRLIIDNLHLRSAHKRRLPAKPPEQ